MGVAGGAAMPKRQQIAIPPLGSRTTNATTRAVGFNSARLFLPFFLGPTPKHLKYLRCLKFWRSWIPLGLSTRQSQTLTMCAETVLQRVQTLPRVNLPEKA